MKIINPVYHHTHKMLDDEREMVALAKESVSNFAPLYKKYHAQIFRYLYQQVNDLQKAKDLTSQVFVKAIMNLHRYEYRGVPMASWLYRIAKSELNQMYRNENARKTIDIDNVQVFTFMKVFEEEHNQINKKKIHRSLTKLSESDLHLIKLRYFESHSYREIGDILKIKENNAKVKTFRALNRLRDIFNQAS